MASLFNKLKDVVSNLTRTPAETAAELREALTASNINFKEEGNAIVVEIPETPQQPYERKIAFKPEKDTISGTISVMAKVAENASATGVKLPDGYKLNVQKDAVMIDFTQPVAEIINDCPATINTYMKITDDVLQKLGVPMVVFNYDNIRAALKKAQKSTFFSGPNYLFVTFDDPVENWYIAFHWANGVLSLKTVIRLEVADLFQNEGLTAKYNYPLTTVSKEIHAKKLKSFEDLEAELASYIKKVKYVINKISERKDFKTELLEVTVYNNEVVVRKLKDSKFFVKVDEDGDVKLEIPASSDFNYDRFSWVIISPDRITVSVGVSGLTLPDNCEAVLEEMQDSLRGIKFNLDSDNKLRIKAFLDPEDFQPAEDLHFNLHERVHDKLDEVKSVWKDVMKKFGMPVEESDFFVGATIRKAFSSNKYFDKEDADGDLKFVIPGSEKFRPKRFVWMYIKKDRLTLDAGIMKWSKLAKNSDIQKIIKDFNDKHNGFTATESDGTVRLNKSLHLKDISDENPTAKVIKLAEQNLSNIIDALTGLASMAGMKTQYFIPELDVYKSLESNSLVDSVSCNPDYVCIKLKPINTTDGKMLARSEVVVANRDETIDFKCDVRLGAECSSSDTMKLAVKLDVETGQNAERDSGRDYLTIKFSKPISYFDNSDEFGEVFSKCLTETYTVENDASDLALDAINTAIREARERERREQEEKERRERERRERERREREEAERRARQEREEALDSGFNYTLRPDGTVRKLQEGFTEDYPYLRIGVYMVKTGQAADRDGGTISHYDSDTTFREIKSFKGECRVRIEGRSTPQSLEKQFRSVSGLVIKICYNDENDDRYYIGKDSDWYTTPIYDINRKFKEEGYYKADIS